jgi:hypothetical protein
MRSILFLAFVCCFYIPVLHCQPEGSSGKFRVMFWNLENYFDPFDDSLTIDEEFTPMGQMHWTWEKFLKKRNNIFKVIVAAGNPEPPALIGFAEVENRFVLYELLNKTPLMKYEYGIVQRESPDKRGIDAALIYRKDQFTLLRKDFFPVYFDGDSIGLTREIVYVFGLLGGDSLHFFVNHWPSRSGGQAASDSRRCFAGKRLRQLTDSILSRSSHAKILIMGDFNDTPGDASLKDCLGARSDEGLINPPEGKKRKIKKALPVVLPEYSLVNLSGSYQFQEPEAGTHKFQGDWAMLDQVIVSLALLNDVKGLHTELSELQLFQPSFLLIPDDQYLGRKPFRTFNGMRYEGGYSDHLPVLIDLLSDPTPQPF